MQRLVRELTDSNPDLPQRYHCRLLKSDTRNAASLPGGRLYITCGFYQVLADDEHLAAVLAHELAHITANDHQRERCKDQEQALQREMLADCAGADYLEQAGFRREAMGEVIALISDIQPDGWTTRRQARVAQMVAFAD
jgi:predicted Zn-dependent protease